MRVLITGITGFVGSHLAEFLLSQGVEVHGTERKTSSIGNLAGMEGRIKLHVCDLKDAASLKKALSDARPDHIYHLAGHSSVLASLNSPAEVLSTNILGQLNLFEALRELGLKPLIQIAGSAEVYGAVRPEESPIKENCHFRPVSPYGVSKAGQDLMAFQYYKNHGLPVVRTRSFNHTGPRQSEQFVASNFARQVALIEAGKQEPVIYVGNLDPVKDFTDVRDVVRAYWLALEKGEPGEAYNICSGNGHKIRDIVDTYLKRSSVKIEIKEDPARKRSSDTPVMIGDGSRFAARTGWKPTIPFEETLGDLLNYWRDKIADSKPAAKN